jgi:hypothetical protein
MPLPPQRFLSLIEAAQYTANRCNVSEADARDALVTALREGALHSGPERGLYQITDSEPEWKNAEVDWQRRVVRWTILGHVFRSNLNDVQVLRNSIDAWLSSATGAHSAQEAAQVSPKAVGVLPLMTIPSGEERQGETVGTSGAAINAPTKSTKRRYRRREPTYWPALRKFLHQQGDKLDGLSLTEIDARFKRWLETNDARTISALPRSRQAMGKAIQRCLNQVRAQPNSK